jgi:hypothetical protein
VVCAVCMLLTADVVADTLLSACFTRTRALRRLDWLVIGSSHAPAIARLGVPAMYHMECQHGLWNGAGASSSPTGCLAQPPSANSSGCPTSFPILAALGASFNSSAVLAVAAAISTEGRAIHAVAPGRGGSGADAGQELSLRRRVTSVIEASCLPLPY